MSLIPRFYDPTSGVVAVDDVDVREVSVRSLRRNIGFILQDTQLFHASVAQNIAYGRLDATREEIAAAARLAHAASPCRAGNGSGSESRAHSSGMRRF